MNTNIMDTLDVSLWTSNIVDIFKQLVTGYPDYAPKIILAVILIIVGWVVGKMVGNLVVHFVRIIKTGDKTNFGLGKALQKTGVKITSERLAGNIVKWAIIIVFSAAAIDVLNVYKIDYYLQMIFTYLPEVIVSALVLLVGVVIAESLKKVIIGGAKMANVSIAHMLGGVAKWAVLVFVVIIVLSRVEVIEGFPNILFMSLSVILAIAGGLAFGVGGRDTASRHIEKLEKDFSNRKKEK